MKLKKLSAAALAALTVTMMSAVPVLAADDIEVNEDISVSGDYDWTRFAGDHITLNVYNNGLYISDGSDDSVNVLSAFEDLTGIKVNYTTYDSNESLYAKLKSGGVSYDVIFPSDYMVGKMAKEGMLSELNMDNIPNFAGIGETYLDRSFDPGNKYSVPYMWGTTGIIYNTTMVEEPPTKWADMWDVEYTNNVLMFNNSRDAFGTAMYRAGIDVNTTDKSQWEAALQALLEQRPLVKAYVMDEIYNALESGEAAIGAYYAGDYFTMLDAQADDVDLQFYYPDPTNYFIDAMCIPSCCENKELAEVFINFMLSQETAVANAEYIYYASPNSLVYNDETYQEDMGEEAMEILYPEGVNFSEEYNKLAYRNLDDEMLSYMNSLWENLKIN